MNGPILRLLCMAGVLYSVELCLSLLGLPLWVRLACGVTTLHFVWRACTYHDGSAHPIGLYLLISGIYVFAALTEVALFGNRLNLDPERMGDLADMGVAFLLCVGIGFVAFQNKRPLSVVRTKIDQSMVLRALMVCMMLLIFCAVITLQQYGIGIGSISRAEIYSYENALLSSVRGLLALALGLAAAFLAAYETSHGRRFRVARFQLFLTLIVYMGIDLLILGDRRLPMMAMLSVVTNFLPRRLSWRQLTIGVVAALVFVMYGFVRNTPPSQWMSTIVEGDVILSLSPASNEFGGLSIIGGAITNLDYPAPNFPTYGEALIQLVPKSILPDRPLSPTEWFVQVYYPQLASVGASFAFNQVLEARLNWGLPGLALVGLLTGVAIAACSHIRYCGIAIGIPIAVYVFTFSMRMDFASLLRTATVATFATGLVLAFVILTRLQSALSQERWRFK